MRMHNRTWRLILFFLIVFPMLTACADRWGYEGDGNEDHGLLFYPTFRVSYESVKLSKKSITSIKFKGVPSNELILKLQLSDSKGHRNLEGSTAFDASQKINTSGIKIGIELRDNEKIVKVVPLSILSDNWKLASVGRIWYFWNSEFVDLSLNSETQYEVRITVEPEAAFPTGLTLIPILEGAGFGKGDIFR